MKIGHFLFMLAGLVLTAGAIFYVIRWFPVPTMSFSANETLSQTTASTSPGEPVKPIPPPPPVVAHLPTPESVRGIYMTSYVAGEKEWRERLVKMIDETELNSLVIDIKDYTGEIAFAVSDPELVRMGTIAIRIPDIKDFLTDIHKRGVYAIARIAAFQDPALVKKFPNLAVKQATDKTKVWKDRKGQTWVDPGSKEVWDYLIALAKESRAIGFDEVNFDYIRFPSDGDMRNIYYPVSEGKVKAEVMREFFAYVDEKMADSGAVTSADLFGMTATNMDDLNIGQILEHALDNFDYVSPMVYPSHYPPNFMGFKNPNEKPYEVVKYSMDRAALRASTSPGKVRPWLQDFSLGGVIYNAPEIRAQIKAVYDSGLNSWMLWNASNKYTESALLAE